MDHVVNGGWLIICFRSDDYIARYAHVDETLSGVGAVAANCGDCRCRDIAHDEKFGLFAFFHDVVISPVVALDRFDVDESVNVAEPVFAIEFSLTVTRSEK